MLTTTVFGFKKPQTSDPVTALRTAIGDNADLLEAALLSAGGARGIVPVGTVLDYAGSGDPSTSYLVIDGRSLLRSSYTVLFGLIGTTYGAVDGTHFNLPDGRGRTTIGAGSGAGLTARTLAATLGEELHLLTAAESGMNSNSRVTPLSASAPLGLGNPPYFNSAGLNAASGTDYGYSANGTAFAQGIDRNADNSHNNMQPSLVLNKIIRAL